MALLTKEQIFAIQDRVYETIKIPEWGGGEVRVQSLTGAERDEFEASNFTGKGPNKKENFTNFRARLVAASVVDEDGVLYFKGRHEVAILGTKNAGAIQRIFNKAQELSGFSDDDVDDLTEDFGREGDGDSTSV
jgi:hypothetical protein